jgi:hypothetical protein
VTYLFKWLLQGVYACATHLKDLFLRTNLLRTYTCKLQEQTLTP